MQALRPAGRQLQGQHTTEGHPEHRRRFQAAPVEELAQVVYQVDQAETPPQDKAVVLALIVTELLTNAVKHAYGGEPGPIQVRFGEEPGRRIQVTVADQGRGIEQTERADGFGSRLTSLLVSQLEGAIEFQNNFPGTKVVLSVPQAS